MKLLITGGCGFLGSNIAASYLNEGAEVVVIDALFRQGGEENLAWLKGQAKPGQFRHYQIDLAEADLVKDVFEKEAVFDYVCHLGGQVAMTTSLSDPRRDFMTNALGTFNVLEAVRKYSPESLVAYSSTNKVYGDLRGLDYVETETRYTVPAFPNGFNESLPLDFASPYGCSKGAADQYVHDWPRNFGLKTVVFRHSSIYGGRQFSTFDQGWVGWFCAKALEQQGAMKENRDIPFYTIQGTGKQVRDVLHAEDLIRLYRAAYEKREAVSGKAFNIGGGIENSLSLLELFKLLEELLALPTPMQFKKLDRRQSDQDFFVADIRASEADLNWKPQINNREGIKRMLDWIDRAKR